MVYGNSEKGNLIKMIQAISSNRFPPLPKITNMRSMVHVEDVVQAAILVASQDEYKNESYILTDGADYSTREIYEAICLELGKNVPLWSVPYFIFCSLAKFGDMINIIRGNRFIFDSDNLQKLFGNAYYSSEKIKSELGFVPQKTLYNSLAEMISYLKLR